MQLLSTAQFMLGQVVPIPDYHNVSLPAPAWLLELLLMVTFWVHMLFVMTILGSVLVLFTRSCLHLGRRQALCLTDKNMIRSLPPVLSLAITTGIAPLLFVQTLYGHYSYSSNIFLGYFWLASLALLLAGFICLYFAGWLWNWKISLPALAVLPPLFLGIAYIYTNNAILTIQPEHWLAFHRHLSLLHVKDPITIPRFVHNLSYAIVSGGLFLAWVARHNTHQQPGMKNANTTITAAMTFCGLGFLLIAGSGIWYFTSLPTEFKDLFSHLETGNSTLGLSGGTKILWLVMPGMGLLVSLLGMLQPNKKTWLLAATTLNCMLLAIMVLGRELIRRWYLNRDIAGNFSIDNWPVATQTSAIITFLLSFATAMLVIIIMLVLVLKTKRTQNN